MSDSSKEQLTSAVPTSPTTESINKSKGEKSVVEAAPSNDLKLEETSQCINLPIETALEDDTLSKNILQTTESTTAGTDVNVANKENLNEPLTTSETSSGKAVSSTETSASDTQEDSCKENATLSKKTLPTAESTTVVTESLKESLTTSEISSVKASDTQEESSKDILNDEHAKHVTYSQDGTAIYTDPKTNQQYKWCSKQNKWLQSDGSDPTNAYENEHYRWCSESQKWIPKQTQVTETEHYKWDAEKNEWVAKVKQNRDAQPKGTTEIVYDIDENGHRTYTDKDGMIFFWDVEKNAWFPKIDEDFMARYQMNYGFIDNTNESEIEKNKRDLELAVQKEKELAKLVEEAKASEQASKEANQSGLKRKPPPEPPKWFEIDPVHNTKVYVSNLPLDITLDEFADVMGKCGMIMRDPQTQKYKLKLYTEADGQIKGDGLCDYIKVESVDLALKILDEYELRGRKIRVQRAQFQMRGEYNPALKPKRKKKDKEKLAKIKEKLFDWRPEKMRGERSKHEKTVIIKNLFHPELFEKEVQLILDYQNDLREECSKCGTVRKVVIYDRHSEGVAQVNMSSPEEADLVIQMMQGRYFGKRKLTAEHWDGKTKYKIEETEEEIQKRLNKWDQYLETEENKKSNLQQQQEEEKIDSPKNPQIEKEVLDPGPN